MENRIMNSFIYIYKILPIIYIKLYLGTISLPTIDMSRYLIAMPQWIQLQYDTNVRHTFTSLIGISMLFCKLDQNLGAPCKHAEFKSNYIQIK